ncbi:MAG: S41 family peptidase [Bacteroidales bacterium]|nr:S41 family peptidase [Bacteroidales bacterium]
MKKILFFVLIALSYWGFSQTDVSWIRYPSISPDGKEIAFTYKGDIYKVSVDGGRAVQLTSHPSYNYNPKWSPDGTKIAFNSNRFGNHDVFVIPSEGGNPMRLTTNSVNERLQTFSPDGKEIYFTANIQHPATYTQFPTGWATQLFKVSADGGRSILVLPNAMNNVTISSDGKFLVYEDIKGQENEWRKHHTSSVARDIWRYDFETKEFLQLTTHIAEDRNPVLNHHGETVYFLSERSGSFNIRKLQLNQEETNATSVTNYERHPVRFLSVSNDETLCYAYDGKLYVLPRNGEPKQVQVDIFRDNETLTTQFITNGATEAKFSPNGKEVALIIRGDVYVTSVDFETTKRITNTPGTERWLTWSQDGRSLAYASEKDGNWSIKIAQNMAKNEPYFFASDHIVEEFLVNDATFQDFKPVFSPNGKEIAFLRDRKTINIVDVASKQIRQITDGSRNWSSSDGDIQFSWSSDGKWLTLMFMGATRHPYLDIGLVSTQGGEIINLTNSGYMQRSPSFAMNGNVILFASDRYGMRSHGSWGSQDDVFGIFTNQAALDRFKMSKEDIELDNERRKLSGEKRDTSAPVLDLKNIENRIERLTINSNNLAGFAMTPDGEKLFYLANVERGYDLWVRDFKENETKLLEKLNTGSASLEIDAKGDKLMIFSNGTVFTLDVKNTKTRKNITYRAQVDANPYDNRAEMFTHVWQTVADRFYREDLHGVDWDGLKKDYEKFLPHINNYWDFAELLSEYLGELNASHTGGSYNAPNLGGVATAKVGLLFDFTKAEKGLKIEEVIVGGPFDNAKSKVKSGHYLTKINGEEILENTDVFAMLNGLVRSETTFTFLDGKTEYSERIRPISSGVESELLYERWVQNQRDRVEKLSAGRLGYAHVRQMSDPSYRTVWSEIMGRYYEKEGVVIDVRFNGGGRMHEDIEVMLSGTKYLEQVPRGQKINDQPTKRWLKPSVMVQGEASYSNAHGTPWVYQEMNIGKLVGMPVPGTMTTVWWENLPENGLRYGIPIAGFIDRNKNFLENQQLEPHVKVRNETHILWENRDQQIEEAVKVLLQDVDIFVDPWENFEYNQKK